MSVNLAVVRGHLTSPPEVRILPSGRELATLQLTTRPSAEALSVPVAVWDPPAWLAALDTGAELVAVGSVRRRFFRSGGSTASRVELEASSVAPAGDRRRVGALRRRVDAAIDALDGVGSTGI
jgi:single-strand DNA-binding protein